MIKKGKLLTGRQILFMIYRHLASSQSKDSLHGMTGVLAGTKWAGDGNKQGFWNAWERKIQGPGGYLPDWVKADILVDCLNQSQDLKFDMMAYRKDHPGTLTAEDGTERYHALIKILKERIDWER
jgi:hypothetical protein